MKRFVLVTISYSQIAVLVALAILATAAYAQTITTFDVPNSTGTIPQGINMRGEIAGYYHDLIGDGTHSFLRKKNGAITTFGVQTFRPWNTLAYGINPSGEIVGTVAYPDGDSGFLRRTDGTIVEFAGSGTSKPSTLLTEPEPRHICDIDGTAALAINARGQITGTFGQGCLVGYLRQPDGTSILFQVGTGPENVAPYAINLKGQITGYYRAYSTGDFINHGFMRRRNGTVVTFDAPNSSGTIPQGINFFGQIAGYYEDANDSSVLHGFVRQPDGTLLTFDPPTSVSTQVSAINKRGEITGFYASADGIYHGFIRNQDGVIESFDAEDGGNPGTFPKDINDRGQIVGYYQDANFALHGFVRSERCRERIGVHEVLR